MIEINLLPAGIRTTEGTPPRRFAMYIGFLMVLLAIGFYIFKYRTIELPKMDQNIKIATQDKEKLLKQQQEVDSVTAEIDKLNKKIQDLDDLNMSRVRFARLFDRLTNSLPEGVWFRSFSVAPDVSVSQRYAPAGRRYAMTINGNAVGGTQQERNHKITELLSNVAKQLNIPPESVTPPTPTPDDFGFCKFIGARFEFPRLGSIATAALPLMQGLDPKQILQLNPPKEGVDFPITIIFDMPLPKNTGQ